MNLIEAMARQEGFYVTGSRAQRNHNPGNIEYGKFARAHGATGSDDRFAQFPSDEAGFAAMRALLGSAYRGMSLRQTINRYAPPYENATGIYLARVCEWTNLKPTDIIDQHLA